MVTIESRVLAIIELKSIVGTNPGQNFNNRTDEALGQAVDVWKAVERAIISSPLLPWLGYFMLIEDNDAWNRVSAQHSAVWPSDPVFENTSAADRATIFFDRMVRERLLDAACVVMADRRRRLQARQPHIPVIRRRPLRSCSPVQSNKSRSQLVRPNEQPCRYAGCDAPATQ